MWRLSLSDSVLIQLISTIGTVVTVILTTWKTNRKIDQKHEETNEKIDRVGATIALARASGEYPNRQQLADMPPKNHFDGGSFLSRNRRKNSDA